MSSGETGNTLFFQQNGDDVEVRFSANDWERSLFDQPQADAEEGLY